MVYPFPHDYLIRLGLRINGEDKMKFGIVEEYPYYI